MENSVVLIMFLSTTGMGDAPDSGFGIESWLKNPDVISNLNLNYCVFLYNFEN